MNDRKRLLWRRVMMLAVCWYGWMVFCLYMGMDWSIAMIIAVLAGALMCFAVWMTMDITHSFDVHICINGWKRWWHRLKDVDRVVAQSKSFMAGGVALLLMAGHLVYLGLHDNGTEMRWCNGKDNLYVVHDYGDTHYVDDAKWGKVCIERCRFCTFERIHLIEYWYPWGELEYSNVYVAKSRFSDRFDVYYQVWYDKNKPEMQYRKIKEEEIVRMKNKDKK